MAITRLFSIMLAAAFVLLIPAVSHAEDEGPRTYSESRIHSTDHVVNGCYAGTYNPRTGRCTGPSSPRACASVPRRGWNGRVYYVQSGSCSVQEIKVQDYNPESMNPWKRWRAYHQQ